MKILGLCSFPVESAATRYRLVQYIEPLAKEGIELTVMSFLDSEQFKQFYQKGNKLSKILNLIFPLIKHFIESIKVRKYDLIVIQREAMFFGPAFFELLFQKIGNCPIVLDLDDATYVSYISPTYGKIGSFFKFFGKTDKLINRAETVICGNRFIAEYVDSKNKKSVVVPTIVDTEIFLPFEKENQIPVIGWVGTHSTFPLLESVFPVLKKLAEKYDFTLKIVGAGKQNVKIDGVKIENLDWNLEREVSDFQSFDIGLYPITTSASASQEWLLGKSGFKAIQYLAVGIPYVVTPVGICAEIGIDGETHFSATTAKEWYNSLEKLLLDENLRKQMGAKGRDFSVKHFSLEEQTEILIQTFSEVVKNYKKA